MKTDVDDEVIQLGLLGTEQEREDAIRDAYEHYKRPLFAFIKERVAPTLDSDEITTAINDVFRGLAKLVSRGKFKLGGSLRPLLFTMARRKAYDQLRRKMRNKTEFEPDPVIDAGCEDIHGDPEDEAFSVCIAQKLNDEPEVSAIWKNAVDEAQANEIMREFRLWLGTARLPRLQRKVAQAIAALFEQYSGDVPDIAVCHYLAASGERPTVASVKSARNQLIEKFASLIKSKERKAQP